MNRGPSMISTDKGSIPNPKGKNRGPPALKDVVSEKEQRRTRQERGAFEEGTPIQGGGSNRGRSFQGRRETPSSKKARQLGTRAERYLTVTGGPGGDPGRGTALLHFRDRNSRSNKSLNFNHDKAALQHTERHRWVKVVRPKRERPELTWSVTGRHSTTSGDEETQFRKGGKKISRDLTFQGMTRHLLFEREESAWRRSKEAQMHGRKRANWDWGDRSDWRISDKTRMKTIESGRARWST